MEKTGEFCHLLQYSWKGSCLGILSKTDGTDRPVLTGIRVTLSDSQPFLPSFNLRCVGNVSDGRTGQTVFTWYDSMLATGNAERLGKVTHLRQAVETSRKRFALSPNLQSTLHVTAHQEKGAEVLPAPANQLRTSLFICSSKN